MRSRRNLPLSALYVATPSVEFSSKQFDSDGAVIDCSTINAARITKVLGTVTRKGDELVGVDGVDDRPHRRSWFIRPDGDLSVVPIELLEAVAIDDARSRPLQSTLPVATSGRTDVLDRARKYLAKMEPSIQGQKGSDRAYAAACAMILGFELSVDDAYRLLCNDFNPRCEPAWSEKELRHKIDDACKATGERGQLLRGKPKAWFDDARHVEFMRDPVEAKPSPSEQSKSIEQPWPDPEPLPDQLCSVLKYDSGLLPESIGSAVDDIAERMQCPPDFPAAAMLVALAAVIGCRIGIRPRRHDDWLVIPNLWGCVVGRPSLKKSPAIQTAEKRIRAIEARDRQRLAEDIGNYEIEAVLAQSKIKTNRSAIDAAMKKGDSEKARQLAEETADLADKPAPVPRRIITTDSSIEKLGEMLGLHSDGMLLWVDELVGWMRSLDRDDKAGVRQQYLTLWNGHGV